MDQTPSVTRLRHARANDERALESLLVEHLPGLEAYLRVRIGIRLRARESVDDLVQSVCIAVLEDAENFEVRSEAEFRAWLYKEAFHRMVNKNVYWSREKRDVGREIPVDASNRSTAGAIQLLASIGTPSEAAMQREQIEALEGALDELPDDYREAIALHKIAGLSHREVAEAMDRSEGAVRNLVYRGLARLAERLASPPES